jgi:hypothetical protein
MDYHAIFVAAATRLLGPSVAQTIGTPTSTPVTIKPDHLNMTRSISPINPDDLMAIFRTLRDRNIKFIAPKRNVVATQPSVPVGSYVTNSGCDVSMYLSKHTFIRAVICAIDPLLQCDVHVAKRIKQTIDATMISILSDTTGVVKRFRTACGVRQPSAEDMRSSLYETDIIMLDSHLNDIAIFQLTQSLNTGIVISTKCGARIIPANLSIHDRAVIITETDASDKSFKCCDGQICGTLLQMMKKQTSMINGSVMPSMKVSEIRAILVDQIGIGNKQASEILSTIEHDKTMPMSKKNMLKIIDILKTG